MKITLREITEQILMAVSDEFVACVKKKENVITISFINGQEFSMKIQEK